VPIGGSSYRRFTAPDRPLFAPRFRAPGLGDDSGDEVPSEAIGPRGVLPGQTHADGGFTGIVSRSRFYSPLANPVVGHGEQSTVAPAPSFYDPARGHSQFDELPTPAGDIRPNTEFPVRSEYDPSLEGPTRELVALGAIAYERNYGEAAVGAQPIVGPPSWYAAGPISKAMRRVTYTLRREFMQGAQSFPGLHGSQEKKANVSTSPVRMTGARNNRLTLRELPASFGATTEVIR
jgi:hypothetical protein